MLVKIAFLLSAAAVYAQEDVFSPIDPASATATKFTLESIKKYAPDCES